MSVLTKRTAEVGDTTMAYVDEGEGRPIVFLHGNPTSSYLWRNVIPHVAGRGRVIAPDLVGHGDSAKLPGTGDERYSLAEHQAYLDALLHQLGVDGDAVLVGHDWGGPLGFDWARRHPDAVAGIAYMETIVRPFTWAGLGEIAELFRAWRSPAGEDLVLQGNQFVEGLVPQAIMRQLSDDEWAEYLRPWLSPGEDRRPTLAWPRQIPIDGEPADVHATIDACAEFLRTTGAGPQHAAARVGEHAHRPGVDAGRDKRLGGRRAGPIAQDLAGDDAAHEQRAVRCGGDAFREEAVSRNGQA
jgi:haloalkane dehalogenase